MRQAALRLWKFLGRLADKRPSLPNARAGTSRRPSVRLELLSLEHRITPSASTLGTLSGAVVLGGGVTPGQFFSLQGIDVTLTGTSNQGDVVDMSATTDGSGTFAFRSVEAGTYELTALPDATLTQGGEVAGVTVVAGQSTTQDVTVGGLAGAVISLRDFLNTPAQNGFGLPSAGPTSDSPPTVTQSIAKVVVASGGSTTIDLAASFTDPNLTQTQVVFDTSDGPMVVNLDDAAAPQTVANFLDYVENSRYDDTIFHRLDTNPPVLQGGGFGLTNPSGYVTGFPGVANSTDPLLANEFSSSLPDTLGTLAMAKLGGNPNSATSQFFFNLADNSSTLGGSNNGGFAVFGSVASDPTSQAVFQALQGTHVQDESAFNSAFGTLPINASANLTSFPTNTTPSNYLTVNDIHVGKQDESLTYSVVSNSDPSLVNASFVAGHPEVLSINPVGASGTATITVQATDQFGLSVQTSFQVTVEPLAITSATNPVNNTNVTSTTASGTATAGESISVTATDGTNTTSAVRVTAGSDGTWKATGINVTSLTDGTITYTATTTDANGNTLTATKTSTKVTVAPTVAITASTNPINIANQTDAAVSGTATSGTATAGAAISVTATDAAGKTVTATTAATGGTWAVNFDVSSLADGTITYSVVATNAADNTATTSGTALKDTVAPPITFTSVTDPITSDNETTTSANGTTEVGATVTVTATDTEGTTTAPVKATVDGSGTWAAAPIDVSGLANGTITYTATVTDTAGNTNTASMTATKS